LSEIHHPGKIKRQTAEAEKRKEKWFRHLFRGGGRSYLSEPPRKRGKGGLK